MSDCPTCEGRGTVKTFAPVRIDTLRNRVNATIDLLKLLAAQLEDLHVLAYERNVARVEMERVQGGDRDYALDTHGDPRARDAFRALNTTTMSAAEWIATATHDALRLLTEGKPPTSGTRKATAVEVGHALVAQSRRVQRGEYTPYRGFPQPGIDTSLKATEQENERLTREVKKLEKRLRATKARLDDALARHFKRGA